MPVLIIQSKQFVQLYVTDKSQWVTIHGVPSGTHKQIVCSHFGHTLGKMHAFNRAYRCHVISHLTKYFFILNAAAFSAPTIPNMQWTCANGYRFRSIFDSFFLLLTITFVCRCTFMVLLFFSTNRHMTDMTKPCLHVTDSKSIQPNEDEMQNLLAVQVL